MFQGAYVAVVTPLKDGKVDYESLGKLINWQIERGISGIVPCGSTGESATLSHKEHEEVVRFTIKIVNKRVPVIAGSGSNNTEEALRLTKSAKDMGADGVLVIAPYYNKPNQRGLYEHYKALNDNVDIPIVIYNIPGRTGRNIEADTIIKLSQLKNIVGVKEASGNLNQASKIIRDSAKGFVVLSGEDDLTLPLMSLGAKGVISATANIIPSEFADLTKYALAGDMVKARKIQLGILEIIDAMFMDINPAPVKEALAMMGWVGSDFRLPMVPLSDSDRENLKSVLRKYKLI